MRNYTTQMDAARKGIITPEMKAVAAKEYRTEEEIRDLVAKGQVAICANKNHKCIDPNGVGSMLRTKINVNLGVSKDCKDYSIEMEKVMAAVEMGAEAIMDLSSHGDTQPFRRKLTSECPAMIGTVPVYDSGLVKIGFYPVLPREAKIIVYKNEYWIRYSFRSGREKAACKLSECAMLKKFQFDNDFFGESNIVLEDTLDLIDIQRQGIKEAVKSTAAYRFMAKLSNFSKMADLEKEREGFTESAFGKEAKKKNGLLLFPNTYQDIKQIELKPWTPDKDQMEQINQNVYNYFGVNEDILQNKAQGDAWSAFYEGAIEPFSIQLSETLTHALFSEREISIGAEVIFTANRVQYMSFKDKLDYVRSMTDRGLMLIDEAREVFNLAPLPNNEGKKRLSRGEYYDPTSEA